MTYGQPLTAEDAIEAIQAIYRGDLDNPTLIVFGDLKENREAVIQRILRTYKNVVPDPPDVERYLSVLRGVREFCIGHLPSQSWYCMDAGGSILKGVREPGFAPDGSWMFYGECYKMPELVTLSIEPPSIAEARFCLIGPDD